MKTYIAIPVLSENNTVSEILNKIVLSLYTEIRENEYKENMDKTIFIFDVTKNGISKRLKNLIRSYSAYNVFYKREKLAKKYFSKDLRMNLAIGSALRHFNTFDKDKMEISNQKSYSNFLWISENCYFENFDLQLFVDQSSIYHAISPVISSRNGLEVYKGIFDRFGVEYLMLDDPIDFITGEIEQTYSLNPKCFALSHNIAHKLKIHKVVDMNPVEYLNNLVYENSSIQPRLKSDIFVHEHLY